MIKYFLKKLEIDFNCVIVVRVSLGTPLIATSVKQLRAVTAECYHALSTKHSKWEPFCQQSKMRSVALWTTILISCSIYFAYSLIL